MAGEQKGKAYEAFTKAALQRLKAKRSFKGDIFWDDKPDGMTIIPDLSIGADKDHPNTVILVTHCGSAKNSDMKYWRNMGELAEAKIFLPTVPKVFNLAFDSVIKENLKEAQDSSFDGQLLVGDKKYGNKLQQWIDHNLKSFPKDKHEKVDFIVDEAKKDKILKPLLDQFTVDLEALLKKRAPVELEQVWVMERSRSPGRAPRARDTFVRRGLSKLLIFEDLDVALRLFSGKRVKADEVPEYAYELGLATRFTSGSSGIAKPADEEIVNAVTILGDEQTKRVLANAPISELSAWLVSLRNSGHMLAIRDYLISEHANLINPGTLFKRLAELHAKPNSLISGKNTPPNWPPRSVWLFEVLMEIPKLLNEDPTSYGYAQMERECEKLKGMPRAGDPIYRTTIPGWVHRRAGSAVDSKVLQGVSTVLAKHLASTSAKSLSSVLSDENLKGYFNNLIEAKLCTYRMFEPLRLLIESTVSGAKKDSVRSCFGEKAELPGQATKTTVLRKGKTLINWQSCHGSHTNDKKKELCGRVVALRYSWDAKSKKFVPRTGVEKLILVVDGTWKREDLLTLARAGWDEIYYPDEMDKLAKAIV
jgi:hypothetical protein